MNEKIELFFAAFDLHLGNGIDPVEALKRAAADYAHVFHVDDGRSELARAADAALAALREGQAIEYTEISTQGECRCVG